MLTSKPPWVQVVGVVAICTFAFFVVGAVYWLASGELPGGIVAPALGFAVVASAGVLLHLRKPSQPGLPDFLHQDLMADLTEAGLRDYSIQLLANNDFPLPVALGRHVYLSAGMVDHLSPLAIKWATVGCAQGQKNEPKYLYWTFGGLLLCSLFAIGLGERYEASGTWWLCVALITLIAAFVIAINISYRTAIRADAKITKTEADRCAAKEALSYAFFAQADRPLYNKWSFLRSDLAGRARALNIDLERGYRVDSASKVFFQ
jgi:hypothetical protein